MRITEIYQSIQGETAQAGRLCTLVRTTGCDLRCSWCDTPHAFFGGREMSVDQILAAVAELAPRLVLLTGGEPLLQLELPQLAEALLGRGYEVMCETGGAHDVAVLPAGVRRIVDCKAPGSGETGRMLWANFEGGRLEPGRDAVKFVLRDERDYEWARDVMARYRLAEQCEVLLSPVHGELDPRALIAWMLRDRLPARLNLQIHKYVWGKDAQGV
ncbi:MAG TPA: radical SAM protein [Polyangia bacterium]|nr:radical SAM protein [Polyangia bacterium]